MIHEVIDIDDVPIEFHEHLQLRKASNEEIELFKSCLVTNTNIFPVATIDGKLDIPIYEARYEEKQVNGGPIGYSAKRNNPNEYRYWVFYDLLQENMDEEFDVLKIALKLLSREITLSIHYDLVNSYTWNPSELFQNAIDTSVLLRNEVPCMKRDDFSNLMPYIEGLIEIKNSYPQLKLPYQIYYSTFLLHRYSKQQLLILFSALEALITHNPLDSGDSITKQLVSKINLLNNRFENPIDENILTNKISLDKFIKKLYTFRSAMAHGGCFKYDNFIENEQMGCWYVKSILKKCLIQAIKEPKLIVDLSKC